MLQDTQGTGGFKIMNSLNKFCKIFPFLLENMSITSVISGTEV